MNVVVSRVIAVVSHVNVVVPRVNVVGSHEGAVPKRATIIEKNCSVQLSCDIKECRMCPKH